MVTLCRRQPLWSGFRRSVDHSILPNRQISVPACPEIASTLRLVTASVILPRSNPTWKADAGSDGPSRAGARMLARLCSRMLGDALLAEDAAQAAALLAFLHLDRLKQATQFASGSLGSG